METSDESTLRRCARNRGYIVRKSRRKNHTNWDRGRYMLIHADTNIIVVGPNFDADTPDIVAFLAKFDATADV